ncbi:PepSY-associated TM helix domain-containing protein [Thalassobaculum sp.]|uniref:PepSY-associated TM helix domain-containing protein n=1 Tax=Thalassobaculum sp. TaxID=2022740 RepID=UPI0032ED3597
MLYRWLRRLHLALFLISAVPLTLLSLTGALLVYGPELQEALEPEIWAVEPRGAPLPVRELLGRVAEQRPELKPWSVAFDPRPDRAWRIWLGGGQGAMNVDPYDGRVLAHYHPNRNAQGIVTALHRRWLVDDKTAAPWVRHAVSAVALALMLQVLVGVGIWLTPPRRLARLSVDFSKRPRMVVIRLHQLAGVTTALLLLTVAFTGLAMYWHAPARAAIEAATGSRVAEQPELETAGRAPIADLDAAVAVGRAAFPEARLRHLRVPSRPGDAAVLHLEADGIGPPSRVWVGDHPPRILALQDGAAASTATWIWQMRYPLHVGEFAGPVVRALWVVVALMPAAFVATGLWLYGNRRRHAWAVSAGRTPRGGERTRTSRD